MDYSLPGSSVHGILLARILEWVAIPVSRGSYRPRDRTQVSSFAGGFFIVRATNQTDNKLVFNVFNSLVGPQDPANSIFSPASRAGVLLGGCVSFQRAGGMSVSFPLPRHSTSIGLGVQYRPSRAFLLMMDIATFP